MDLYSYNSILKFIIISYKLTSFDDIYKPTRFDDILDFIKTKYSHIINIIEVYIFWE